MAILNKETWTKIDNNSIFRREYLQQPYNEAITTIVISGSFDQFYSYCRKRKFKSE